MIDNLLYEILNELKRRDYLSSELWDVNDIAKFLRLSKSSVQSRIICRQDFPRCVIIQTTNNRGTRRWLAKEVKAWSMKHREPLH